MFAMTVRFFLLSLHSKRLLILWLYTTVEYKVPAHAWSSSLLTPSREPEGSADNICKCEFFCTSACLKVVQSCNMGCCRRKTNTPGAAQISFTPGPVPFAPKDDSEEETKCLHMVQCQVK